MEIKILIINIIYKKLIKNMKIKIIVIKKIQKINANYAKINENKILFY